MENKTASYRDIGGWILAIFIAGLLNVVGDTVILIQWLLKMRGTNIFFFRIISSRIFFSDIFVNETLFFIAMPLTWLCNVLFLVCIGTRKLFLFKLFFFAACIIALVHLLVNLSALCPLTIFDIVASTNIYTLMPGVLDPALELLRTMYPAFLITGTLTALGLLFVCFLYFRRSRRVAVYFGSSNSV
jgi:hypothetical protein